MSGFDCQSQKRSLVAYLTKKPFGIYKFNLIYNDSTFFESIFLKIFYFDVVFAHPAMEFGCYGSD